MSDVRKMMRAGLANRFNNAVGRLLQFHNECHDAGGRFCSEVGGMSDSELAREKAAIQEHFKTPGGADAGHRGRLRDISAEQRRRDAGGKQRQSAPVGNPAHTAGGDWRDAVLAERMKPGNPKKGTEFLGRDAYTGEPVRVSTKAAWISKDDLENRQITYFDKKTQGTKTASLADYTKDVLHGYAVSRTVGGQEEFLSPDPKDTDHSLYRASQFDMADVLYGAKMDGEKPGPSRLKQMIEDPKAQALVVNEQRPSGTRAGVRVNNQLTRIYQFGAKTGFAVSAVVDPKSGRVITSGVEFPEGRLIGKNDIQELRDRTEKWKKENGLTVQTKLVRLGG